MSISILRYSTLYVLLIEAYLGFRFIANLLLIAFVPPKSICLVVQAPDAQLFIPHSLTLLFEYYIMRVYLHLYLHTTKSYALKETQRTSGKYMSSCCLT